ncbi:MAG: pimeloyl-CoA dehydrogenase large subunit [Pseudomonadales bacterium]|nr:pimeloyl-CoA dehydrogenase large subunit [Pseudomonadales bacterium]
MRHSLTSEQAKFKAEVEDFLATTLPSEISTRIKLGAGISKDDLGAWTKQLNQKGWAAPNWPEEYGGTGWNLMQRHIFDVACRQAHAPVLSGFGFNMVGPAIIEYGTEAQKQDFLPRIRNADLWFCQGYSEPQAGSDLASVRTRADRDGDDYVVNGQKIWTSGAEDADWIFCLVRTNHDVQQRLGDEDRGWTVAKSLLGDERLLVSRVAENKRIFSIIKETVALQRARGIDVPVSVLQEIDELEVRLSALEMTSLRILTQADAGSQIGAEPSMLKLKGSELVQAQDDVLFRIVDHLVMPLDSKNSNRTAIEPSFAEYVASGRYHHRGFTIAGGSSEVQHNIIAKQVLGL